MKETTKTRFIYKYVRCRATCKGGVSTFSRTGGCVVCFAVCFPRCRVPAVVGCNLSRKTRLRPGGVRVDRRTRDRFVERGKFCSSGR